MNSASNYHIGFSNDASMLTPRVARIVMLMFGNEPAGAEAILQVRAATPSDDERFTCDNTRAFNPFAVAIGRQLLAKRPIRMATVYAIVSVLDRIWP